MTTPGSKIKNTYETTLSSTEETPQEEEAKFAAQIEVSDTDSSFVPDELKE